MGDYPSDRKYTRSHEWVKGSGNGEYIVGVTGHVLPDDVVWVVSPEVGWTIDADIACGTVETVTHAFDVHTPLAGKITAINDTLVDDPELVSADPYDEGWLFRIKAPDTTGLSELMDATKYQAFVAE